MSREGERDRGRGELLERIVLSVRAAVGMHGSLRDFSFPPEEGIETLRSQIFRLHEVGAAHFSNA